MKKPRGRPKLSADPCLTPGCGTVRTGRARGGRGVCKRCLNAFAYLVRKGETTWEHLERAGLVLAKSLPFSVAYLGDAPWRAAGRRG